MRAFLPTDSTSATRSAGKAIFERQSGQAAAGPDVDQADRLPGAKPVEQGQGRRQRVQEVTGLHLARLDDAGQVDATVRVAERGAELVELGELTGGQLDAEELGAVNQGAHNVEIGLTCSGPAAGIRIL